MSGWRLRGFDPHEPPSRGLTPRERDCLSCAARGLTYAETATALSLSTRTVEHHLAIARRKLGAFSTTQAVGVAQRRGLFRIRVA